MLKASVAYSHHNLNGLFKILVKKKKIDLVGVGDVSLGLAKELKHMPIAISLAVRHPVGIKQSGANDFYIYQYEEVDRNLESTQDLLVKQLRKDGWRALAIPPDSLKMDNRFIARLYPLFPHKTAATCAGLGWIGKNGMLINKVYGARMSWATVLTNAPLEVSSKPYLRGSCGQCRRCVDACPAGAIKDTEWVRGRVNTHHIDVQACAGNIAKNEKIYGQAICGLCINACPRGVSKKHLGHVNVEHLNEVNLHLR